MSTIPALHGLAALTCADKAIADLLGRRGQDRLDITAPDAARPFVVACLASATPGESAPAPLLVVSANGREADDLTAELAELLDDPSAVAQFPSWETLPHERLSPSADTVGQRLAVLHRLAEPDDAAPLRVVVTTVRSLVQPMAPGLGSVRTILLREGLELDFEQLLTDLVEMAYERVDMVGRRGEFAVRGGILDVFPTTADYPVRVEFWGDEITEMRAFSVADQRSQPEIDASTVRIHPGRELILSAEVRARAADLVVEHAGEKVLADMLAKLAEGIPVEGMEALIPMLVDGQMQMLTEVMPDGTGVLLLDPEKIRTRAAVQDASRNSAPVCARSAARV
ncbi:MAG: transcription-repair coupling factor, partial [Actinomycetota bacterium]|nr:transcription-repair coupling factor [Actinomycetota bacterium]